jgi:phosphoserine aminotransferase
MSVMEVSHRSKPFEAILAESESLLRELIGIPESYSVLFLQGGASLQFSMIPMNLLRGAEKPADFIVTGTWGTKAQQEAQREGKANVAWDGKGSNYSHLPAAGDYKLSSDAAYVHITSNETIQGVEFPGDPQFGSAPLVCDASSNFLSRPIDITRYGLVYACAQKNAGISGVTVVILRKDLLERTPEGVPTMLDYRVHAKNGSMYNTPPTFAVYILTLVLRWLKNDIGGLAAMAKRNQSKAKLLYDVLDQHSDFYQPHARKDSRSQMNVTWRMPSEESEKAFLAGAKELGLIDLKGHRSVGGIRASIYNAMPVEGVEKLRDHMLAFRKR